MKKPELKDYDLTDADLTKYDEQRKEYQKAVANAFKEAENTKKIIMKCLVIASIAIGIIFAILYAECWFIALIAPFSFTIIPLIILFQTLDSTGISKSKSAELNLLIDKNLKQKCETYKSKLSEYEQYIEKCSKEFWVFLNGYEFEKEVAKLFMQMGYKAQLTPKTGDGGVDIILTTKNERIAVQCKHHKNKVGPHDVRALQGVVHNRNYTSGIFVSLNGFTPTVPKEVRAGKEEILLLSLDELILLQEKL
jgi:HJR/Mrr/RecB family endonuclease